MASFLDKIKLPSSLDKRSVFDLSCDHVTTMNFFKGKISYIKEMVPKEKISVGVESLVRVPALQVPTFGRYSLVHRAFFVPMRTIFTEWNTFITNTFSLSTGAIISQVPYISNNTFVNNFVSNTLYANSTTSTTARYDIVRTTGSATTKYILTETGRYILDFFASCGIRFSWVTTDTTQISALPVLAVLKMMQDWYSNSQYELPIEIDQFIMNNSTVKSGGDITKDLMNLVYSFAYTKCSQYDQDYFTSAFSEPSGPSSDISLEGEISFVPSDSEEAATTIDAGNVAVMSNTSNLSKLAIQGLTHLSDFLKRYQLSGAKAIDRYLARFGVRLADEKLNRSVYLGSNKTPIQIGEVLSTADTDGAAIGDYAGKGIAYGNNGKFSYSTDEFGYFIIYSQIIPKIGYVQGIDRTALHLTPTDFFTGEFDGLGNQAIARKELYSPFDGSKGWSFLDSTQASIFGYTPRYAEYKVGRDKLTGDYQFGSMNNGEDSWYSFRMFPDSNDTNTMPIYYKTASTTFVQTNSDESQYKRVFNNEGQSVDYFRCIFHFDVRDEAPMRQLFDNYEWENNGQEVSLQVNGTNLNGVTE